MDKCLTPALRQYRHNTNAEPGFVFAYDAKETEKIVDGLQKRIEQLEGDLEIKDALIDCIISWSEDPLVEIWRCDLPLIIQGIIENMRKEREGSDGNSIYICEC